MTRFVTLLMSVLLVGGCSAATSAPTATAACSRTGLGPGVHEFQGRQYLLSLPTDYGRRRAYPLILNFHGYNGNKRKTETNTRMGQVGGARGYIVVTPDGTGTPRRWNYSSGAPDDFGWVQTLLTSMSSALCVDAGRVFAAGHSNGSAFASQLVCKAPHRFRAVAMVSATVPAACPTGVAPSVLAIAGTADKTVPYAGKPGRLPAAVDTIARYGQRYHCHGPARGAAAPGVTQTRYVGCVRGGRVILDTVVGGTHPWPGSAQAVGDPLNSAAGRTFDATDTILDFFGSS